MNIISFNLELFRNLKQSHLLDNAIIFTIYFNGLWSPSYWECYI